MSETKTFKNPSIHWKYQQDIAEYVWCVEDQYSFEGSKYDMVATFTKKDPDFFPGWFLYSDVPEGYPKEIQYFQYPPPNNGWERVHNRG